MSSEAEELDAVLSSPVFFDAPIMARLLKYLGENHFSADRSSLNEYRIGVEALGRSADFDPSKNSCVRVEMHRLRARLRKYYETEGAEHSYRIMLQEGRYGLRFVRTEDERAALPAVSEEFKTLPKEPEFQSAPPITLPVKLPFKVDEQPVLPPGHQEHESSSVFTVSRRTLGVVATAIVLVCAVAWAWIAGRPHRNSLQSADASAATITVSAPGITGAKTSVRILAGHPNAEYIDRDGRTWQGDRYFTGGESVPVKLPYIQGTADPIIYQNAREGEFSYDIPVKNGKYDLRMYFVETTFGPGTFTGRGESSRVFSVFLNDRPLLTDFDILSDAGGNFRAFPRVFKGVSPGNDGMIHLRFSRGLDQPMINALELEPELGIGMNPIRIVMQDNSYVDHAGHKWISDQFAIGGMLAPHPSQAINASDPHLYDGERFGHFTYQIPVAAGRYTVTLHFMETFFGSENPRGDGDPRVFDIYANGSALLRNFSILKRSDGPDKEVSETFHGIEPNAAGLISLSFVPVKNYACVSAIEVTDEAQ